MFKTPLRRLALLMFGLVLSGCGQSPPPKPPVTPAPQVKVTPAPAEPGAGNKLTPTTITGDSGRNPAAPKADAVKLADAAYLSDDVVGLVVVHPRRLTESFFYPMAKDAGLLQSLESELPLGDIKFEEIERVTVVIDQPSVNAVAGSAGLEVPGSEPDSGVVNAMQAKNNLKQVGLAFHLYHDIHGKFPRADGDGEGKQTGLSWRVHLLPLLEESDLFEQFHLDEAWDSDHNKTLIAKMPAVFKTAGVKDAGKTALHVFTGTDTLFDGDKGTTLSAVTDGTSNTILAVSAGADAADVWTKPGGLAFDAKAPKKALGTITEKSFSVLFGDGSVRSLRSSVNDESLSPLIQINDGSIISDEAFAPGNDAPRDVPTLIVTMVKPVDRAAVTGKLLFEAEKEWFEEQEFQKDNGSAVWLPDENTFVFGPIAAVKKMITTKKSGKAGNPAVLAHLDAAADLAFAFNVKSQAGLVQQAVEANPIPGLGMAQQIDSVALHVHVTGKPGAKLLEFVANTADEDSARMISTIAQGFLAQGKQQFKRAPLPPVESDGEKAAVKMAQAVVESASLNQSGSRIEFSVTVPEGFDKLPELLKPALEKARTTAEATKKKNVLRQIGLAFHNYHDVNGTFPGAGRSAAGQKGLSWRVHLLPYMDNGGLYQKFKLDEPWDSEHNKALIEQMPEIFKTDGVTEPGKTSLHVFTGPGAPFADDQAPGISQFTDGSSNTSLVVEAGAETAAIWTKPGGLDFDPKNPLKALGKLTEETIRVLFCDGSVRQIKKTIEPETLRRLIQSADGEPAEGF